jgi:uncharacterized phage-like protein YoqJ
MIFAITGHRPNRLGNEYNGIGPVSIYIRKEINNILDQYDVDTCISGMALGVDMLFAEEALKRNIKVIAAIPFVGQESIWPQTSIVRYNSILSNSNVTKEIICTGKYAAWKMQERNKWMVDHCGKLIAVWNGMKDGGTYNCVQYAQKQEKEIIRIDPGEFNL